MFSERTRFDRTTNRVARALTDRRARGEALLDLTGSNPTEAGIKAPADLLLLLADPAARRYEPTPQGLLPAREAVSRDFARRGHTVGPDRLLLTASTSEAYAYLFKLLCDPGDEVLVPRPGYPLFDYLATLEGVRPVSYPLAFDGEWHLDLPALRERLTPRAKAVVVVSPANPTGQYLKERELEGLLELCREHGLALVSDEVFADFPSRRQSPTSASAAAEDGPALAFTLGGLSKSCGLPQLKLGWIAVRGPAPARDEALARLEIVADSFLSVGTPVQAAAPGLLARLPELQAPLRARVDRNRDALAQALAAPSPATLLPSEGGWSSVVQVPAIVSEEERVLRLLETQGVLVHPGYFFDFPREAFLVVSLLTPPDTFDEGLRRLARDLVL
jgi:aspartate/methionine/tyrosine aminotransferase